MEPTLILLIFLAYTILLFTVTWITARKANSQSFYVGNRISPWFVVAYGMIGASMSGVTFMSVPGWVKDTQFSYMVVVLGYLVGYFVIALVLLPLYYRLKLTSIYTYLEKRFGFWSYKTGAGFFILSRITRSIPPYVPCNKRPSDISFSMPGMCLSGSMCLFLSS